MTMEDNVPILVATDGNKGLFEEPKMMGMLRSSESNIVRTSPLEQRSQPSVFLYREIPSGDLSLAATTTKVTNGQLFAQASTEPLLIRPSDQPVKKNRRDERRRATHNEVERRRRDKINTWIMKLGSIIPDTCEATTRHGPVDGLSKGGILAAACEYITELKEENDNLSRQKIEVATLCETSQSLMEENTRLQQENELLRDLLQRHGLQWEEHIKTEMPS